MVEEDEGSQTDLQRALRLLEEEQRKRGESEAVANELKNEVSSLRSLVETMMAQVQDRLTEPRSRSPSAAPQEVKVGLEPPPFHPPSRASSSRDLPPPPPSVPPSAGELDQAERLLASTLSHI